MDAPLDAHVRTADPAPPAALGWRLIALIYDLLPAAALWMTTSALVYFARGAQPVAPGSIASWLELGLLWLVTGLYCVLSWRLGGQTIGMRPWRLQVVTAAGGTPGWGTLWLRYAVATLAVGVAGLGLLWSLLDRQRRGWHDIAAGTLLVKRPRSR